MAVRARLLFDTIPGDNTERINWRLHISDRAFSGVPLDLVGTSSPVVIDYHKDDDIYKPLQGSSMKINVVVPDSTYALPDFNAGTAFQYEVSLEYQSGANWIDYWKGFINPIQSNESVSTFPFDVSFTATDRLGLLGQQSLVGENVMHDPSLIGYVGRALRQTGLELPLYVDSGIRNANGDAILDLSASQFSFFDAESRRTIS